MERNVRNYIGKALPTFQPLVLDGFSIDAGKVPYQ